MAMWRVRPAALSVSLCLLLGGGLVAAVPPASAAAADDTGVRVMIVDIQTLMEKSKAAQIVRRQIEKKRAEYTKEISEREQALRTERNALQHDQGKYSAQTLRQKGRAFQKKVDALGRSVQKKRQSLEKSSSQAIAKIQDQILKIIDAMAKKRKANLVLQRAGVLFYSPQFDVTDEVLHELDEKLPSVKVEFSTPAPREQHAKKKKPAPAQSIVKFK